MGHIERTVFISYRRTNLPWALNIYQNLTMHGYDVFFDYESINSGDFKQVILENIRSRTHFLLILTPSMLERIDEPNDWVRLEIETALDEQRNIIPLFFEGFNFSEPYVSSKLTGKLAKVKDYGGFDVPSSYFSEAMNRLRNRYLMVASEVVKHPVSLVAQEGAQKQQFAASKAKPVLEKEITAQEWFEKAHKNWLDKKFDLSIQYATEAINLNPDFAEAYSRRGAAKSGAGDLEGAIKDYEEAIRINPDFPNPYNNRGIVFNKKGEYINAIKDYSEVIRLRPDDVKAYFNRGIARANKGNLDEAIKDFTEAIRLKPDSPEVYKNRGITRANKGDQDGAIKDFTEAIRIKPDYFDVYRSRGIERSKKGDQDGAIKDYTEAIRLKPDYAEAYRSRGIERSKKGDQVGAIKDYTEAIRLKSDYASAYLSRGLVFINKGDLNQAIKDLTEAIRLNPEYMLAYHNRGIAWDEKDDYYSAIADYEKSIELGNRDTTIPLRIKALRKKIK